MMIDLLIDADQPRRWHGQLAGALAAAGYGCALWAVAVPARAPMPAALDWLLVMDRTLHGGGAHALDRHAVAGGTAAGTADVTLDLTGAGDAVVSGRHVVPLFDGAPGEAALWAALIEGRAPRLELVERQSGAPIEIGLPAIEAPHQLMASADQVIARLVSGIVRAARSDFRGAGGDASSAAVRALTAGPCLTAGTRILATKAERALSRMLGRAPQWSVAWRASDAGAPLPDGVLDLNGWMTLSDDGQRYYADPFPAEAEGRRFVFVEEYPYASERGIISVAEIGADGRALSAPQPVLDTGFHLSYPQVFSEGGVVYMLPEAAASGRLTLYRAERFPDRWVAVADLLSGRVHDATLLKTDDGYWLFATTDGDRGSSWDQLCLWHAAALLGPWTAHAANPVLIDAGAARPGGAIMAAEGALWRPVQDCRAGYGAALGLARIETLTRADFRQGAARRVLPPARGGYSGLHTFNRAAGLEAVDVFGPRPGGS